MRATDLLNEYDTAKECERVKALYELQLAKIKNEEYIRDLILEDLSHKIKQNRSRYDVMKGIFKLAANKDKYNLDLLTEWIAEDFFGGEKIFKITEIMSMGYETYGYNLKLEINGQEYFLEIPIVSNFTTQTLGYSQGKFRFGVHESKSYSVCKVSSWRISDIEDYIKKEILDNGVILL